MPSGSYTQLFQVGAFSLTRSVNKSADAQKVWGDAAAPVVLPAANAIAGANFTNNGDGTAAAALAAGHTLVDGKADLYWAGGIRYGCTVEVTDNAVVISDGDGDALPATATPSTIANQVQVNVQIDGDTAEMIGVGATKRCHVDMQDAAGASVRHFEIPGRDEPDTWDSDRTGANPYTGNPITKAKASNGDSAGAANLTVLVLEDSTPG